jgi:rhamnose transport system substrate-binding protein
MKTLRTRTLLALVAVMALALFAAACGTSKDDSSTSSSSSSTGSSGSSTTSGDTAAANPDAPYKKGMKIYQIPKQLGNPYEDTEDAGTKKAIEEVGGTFVRKGPTDAGASSQVPLIQSITQSKPDGIVIAGNDPDAVAPALKQAMAKGVKVVTQDSDVAPDARTIFVNQSSSELIGTDEVKLLGKLIDYKGEIAILSATANAPNQNTWIKYMKQELAKPEYKDMKLVKVAYGDDDDQKSFQETQGLLQAYPNLKGIISPTTVGISAAARYLSTSPKKGKVVLTGLGTPNQMRKFVKDGTVEAFELWNPEDVGYLGGYAMAALVSGQITGAEGEKFKAGKLGERTIGKNGEVILGPPTRFTKDNIDKFDF